MSRKSNLVKPEYRFFERDLSWLSFNERLLLEAERTSVPLMERIRFLSIYSSNLDEFYRVRIPSLMAIQRFSSDPEATRIGDVLTKIQDTVVRQQERFGKIFQSQLLPELRTHNIHILYNEPIPGPIYDSIKTYFVDVVASYVQVIRISDEPDFFPENNRLYMVVTTQKSTRTQTYIITVPSDCLSRFYSVNHDEATYVLFLEDIIRLNISRMVDGTITECESFKITRDAELNLEDEFTGNLAEKIERKIHERDFGFATRFLYGPGMKESTLMLLRKKLKLKRTSFVPGGAYHNLKDLSALPLHAAAFNYEPWPRTSINFSTDVCLFDRIAENDILLHPPFHTYETVIRFFNEAAIDRTVKTIYVTLYRVASESRIASALITAARNGKKVVVFVELKARFDEANNIKWSKKMKAAGVRIIESIPRLKVHAKLALVKRSTGGDCGLMATGNFNESTARFYTDHILMTSRKHLLDEIEVLFKFLKKRRKKSDHERLTFRHLLVGHFNLQDRFIELIDREMVHARNGKRTGIIIKFNNLEDKVLISKLYEASQAGVSISLVVRGICCLVPGVTGMSENITVTRIIDRYLEHGRIFVFHNSGDTEVYLGSADWMNRNIYSRIEVCFPLENPVLKAEALEIVNLQLRDNCQATELNEDGRHTEVFPQEGEYLLRSQLELSKKLKA